MPGTAPSTARLRTRPLAPARVARRPARPDAAAPIVKWAGGKSRLLDAITARRPPSFRRYFEPFVGGGAVFFRLAPHHAVLSDLNADLIATYRAVAWNVEAVIRRLRTHRDRHCEDYYYATRERWNERTGPQSDVDRAAMFIYLNKTCYNGLWRVNRSGRFNVPIGSYKAPAICDAPGLRAASRLLQRAELATRSYDYVVDAAGRGDFVYFDPPYQPVSATANFTSYTSACFGEDDQRELARVARLLVRKGCAVMLSNSDTPLIRSLYDGFRVDRVTCNRAINSRADGRGAVAEVLITGGY
ncbi:MAG: DNA adenine methylase [Deltaproteobacteria bacterium]|nr:MAG: DNA adenine methylase [Deltaproteobacteria bacterium]